MNNVDFILGSKCEYCLPCTSVVFGNLKPSVYYDTKLGVILVGSVGEMKKNIPYLPDRINSSDSKDPGPSCNSPGLKVRSSVTKVKPKSDNVYKTTAVNFAVLNGDGSVSSSELQKATDQALQSDVRSLNDKLDNLLNYEKNSYNETSDELNDSLVDLTLKTLKRDVDGRLIMRIMWNEKTSHLLGCNFNLSKKILKSSLNKLRKNPEHLRMVDKVFKKQEESKVIERLSDLKSFMKENDSCSFMAHMPVFKMNHQSTKCRVVFLSNVCDRNSGGSIKFNHNQTILPGPCLNRKISTALLNIRFDKYLLCFDLVKAFLQIGLLPEDQTKLCFLWFRDVERGDFEIVGFKSLRLPFGLRCSPSVSDASSFPHINEGRAR